MDTTMQAHHIFPRKFFENYTQQMRRIFGDDLPIGQDDYSNRIMMPQSAEMAEVVRTAKASGDHPFAFEVGGMHHNTSHNGYSNAITEKLKEIMNRVDNNIVTPEVARMMVFDLHQQARALLIEGDLPLNIKNESKEVERRWIEELDRRLADPKDLQSKDSDVYKRVNDYQNNFNHQKFDVGKTPYKATIATHLIYG